MSELKIKPSESKHTIAIVGAGFAGYRFFAESLELTISQGIQDAVRYVFIDPRPVEEYGCGVAWNSSQSEYLRANMHSETIVLDAKGNHTLLGMIEGFEKENVSLSELFESRKKIGEIIHQQFQEAVKLAKHHKVEFHFITDRAKSVERYGKAYKVKSRHGTKIVAHSVILATGHFPSSQYKELRGVEQYIRNPWDWDLLRNIPADADVALLGMGPTAVDSILVLNEVKRRKIQAFSRSGLMQYPRPRPMEIELKLISSELLHNTASAMGGLTLDTVAGLVFAEFHAQGEDWRSLSKAYKNSLHPPNLALREGYALCNELSAWFGIITAIERYVPLIWNLMRDNGYREAFRAIYKRLANLLYGMAPPQTLKMLEILDGGRLQTHKALSSVVWQDDISKFEIKFHQKPNETTSANFDYVVDCTGFGSDLDDCPWLFIRPMLDVGLMYHNEFGGAVVDYNTGQLLDQNKRPIGEIYCLAGSLTIGAHFMTNGLGKVAASAHRSANKIHGLLSQMMRTNQ